MKPGTGKGVVPDPLRVAVVFEGEGVTGPAKNLLRFIAGARRLEPGLPRLEMSLITYRRGAWEEETVLAAEARRAGISACVVQERHRFDFSVLPQIRRYVEAWRPHVIQTHHVKSHFLIRLSRLKRDRLWLAFHHGYTREDLKMQVYNSLDRWSLRAADRVVTVCEAFVRELVKRGVQREKISVLHNSVEVPEGVGRESVSSLRRAIGLEDDTAVVLTVGRLSREKGHQDLLSAIWELRRLLRHKPFRLLIVGEGKERRRIEELRTRYGLEDQVSLLGHQNEVGCYYGVADVLVIPSHSEGSPNVLLEAMAWGVPVVATHVGGIPEIVTDGETALLVPPRDPRAMAEAVARLLESPQERERLATAAREVVRCRHTPDVYQRRLREVYKRLCEENLPRIRGRE